jgi:hypothetical protein
MALVYARPNASRPSRWETLLAAGGHRGSVTFAPVRRPEFVKVPTWVRRVITVAIVTFGAGAAVAAAATPIPSGPGASLFVGRPAHIQPVRHIPRIPRNRFMAPNGRSEIHDDAWQTDSYTWRGPLGRSP